MYLGGKGRIANAVSAAMLAHTPDRTAYLEPFVGGGWIFEKMAPHFTFTAASDVMPDLIKLWKATQSGWRPPTSLSREEYAELRNAEPSALRAFAGFGCSFGGKWFAGYASNRRGDDFAGAAARGIIRKAATMQSTRFRCCSYDSWIARPGWVIYCDPPYADTTPYRGAPTWDANAFWRKANEWVASGATVFVSEYRAPAGWAPIWEQTVKVSLADTNTATAVERLFVRSAS